MTNTIVAQSTAISLQTSDYFLTWQGSQSPSTRKTPVSALGAYYATLASTNTFTQQVTVSSGGVAVTGNSSVTGNLSVSGALSFGSLTGTVTSSAGVVSSGFDSNGANFRFYSNGSGYGAVWRNDNTSAFLLLTNNGNPLAGFNSLRPFSVLNSTGAVSIDGTGVGTTFGGSVIATGEVRSSTGYRTRAGTSGSFGGNDYNIFWTGSVAQLYVDNTFIGNFNFTSDRDIKKDIRQLDESGLAAVMRLRPVVYKFNDVGIFKDDGVERLGFVAQEVAEVIPSAVEGREEGTLSLQPIPLVAALAKATQELHAELQELKERVAELEAECL